MTCNVNKNISSNGSASLDCISINELCSTMNSAVATVHENFTALN